MNIESYADLIREANAQTEPQRLMFVFAKAELPKGYTEEMAGLHWQNKYSARENLPQRPGSSTQTQ